ncbi:ricin-type beta-trefoil lectin domain protein [Streptomyces silvensis]|uniref:ricin-type beta-trefoil lectin domain protein n=1 Tax=Streptomyces silvensis TaxID=1765722 RepID=UPI000ACCBB77|nr:ricin-type beta-trefoil lectin domain protein [Streptomyces silvensis]
MHTTWIKNRLGKGIAAVALAVGIGALQTVSAQAAPDPTYWTFGDSTFERCLTGGKIDGATSRVFLTKCNGSNFQKWDWRGDDPDYYPHEQLQNKATGLCLATDNESMENNAVWASQCEWRKGMRFHYDDAGHTLCPALTNYSTCLVARPNGAVYGTSRGGAYEWWGSRV